MKYRVLDQVAVTGGFFTGVVLSVEEEDNNGEIFDASADYESFDAGFLLGFEVNLTNSVFLEVRYNNGLVNLFAAEIEGGSGSYKNRFIQLGFGFKF